MTERQKQILEEIKNKVVETATGPSGTNKPYNRDEVMRAWVKQHEETIKNQVALDHGYRPTEVYWDAEKESVICKKAFSEEITVVNSDIQTYGVGDPD